MIKFSVGGRAVAKERPRLGNGGFYTPTKTKNYERLVARIFQKHGFDMINGYVGARIKIYMSVPKSKPKKLWIDNIKWSKQNCLDGKIRPTSHGDIDNIVKSVLDGLNGVAFQDDCLVQELHAEKWFAETDYVEVELWELKTRQFISNLESRVKHDTNRSTDNI